MSKIDQLLAKALSTSSEDEAIACLRMARKQPDAKTDNVESSEPDNTVDWYKKAEQYYKFAKDLQSKMSALRNSYDSVKQQMMHYNMLYVGANNALDRKTSELRDLKSWYFKRDTALVILMVIAGVILL